MNFFIWYVTSFPVPQIEKTTFIIFHRDDNCLTKCSKTSQDFRMLSRSDCQSLALNVIIRVSQPVRNSQLCRCCHWFFWCVQRNRCFSVQNLSPKPYFVYFLWVNIFTLPNGQPDCKTYVFDDFPRGVLKIGKTIKMKFWGRGDILKACAMSRKSLNLENVVLPTKGLQEDAAYISFYRTQVRS